MKNKHIKMISVLILCAVMIITALPVSAAWDGVVAVEDENKNNVLVDFSNVATTLTTGALLSKKTPKGTGYSIHWDFHREKKSLGFKNVKRDWSDYTVISFDVYSEVASGERIALRVFTEYVPNAEYNITMFEYIFNVDFTGWKHFTIGTHEFRNTNGADWSKVLNVMLRVDGSAREGTDLYFTSLIGLEDIGDDTEGNSLNVDNMDLSAKEKKMVFDALNGGTAVMNFAFNAVINNETIILPREDILTTDESGSIGTVGFFEKVLSAKANGTSLTVDGITKDFSACAAVYDGVTYLTLKEVLNAFGKNFEQFEMVTVISDSESIKKIKENKSLKTKLMAMLNSNILSAEDITKEDWKQLKDNWRKFFLGDENKNLQDNFVKYKIGVIDSDCEAALELFGKDKEMVIFGEKGVSTTREMTYQSEYILDLAKAYGTYGSKYYKNEDVKEKILYSLEWIYENLYGQDEINGTGWMSTSKYNWSDWYEKTPRTIACVMLIVEEHLTPQLIKKYLSLYESLRPNMKNTITQPHALTRSYCSTISAALYEDFDRMKNMVIDYNLNLDTPEDYTTSGVQEDGQYITHNYFAYTSIYGAEALLGRIPRIQSILAGTKFEFATHHKYNSCKWLYETFDPVMFYGYLTNAQAGRGHSNEEQHTGVVIATALDFIGCFGKDDDVKLKQFVKRHVRDENIGFILEDLEIDQIVKLRKVLSDDSVQAEPYYANKIYYTGDSVMHHRGDYGLALSMSSTRIAKWESINGANTKGWYRGDGMLYLYLEKEPGYGSRYYSGVNYYHLPGTTVDTQERIPASIADSSEALAKQDFVGGAGIDNLYATVAMQFEDYHNDNKDAVVETNSGHGGDAPYHQSSLMAKKSWFMFDDEVVAIGSDINAHDGFEVHTVVENRRLEKNEFINGADVEGAHLVTVDGTPLEKATSYRKSFKNPTWAHIEGTCGYYFPAGGSLEMNKGTTYGNYLEMWLNHGVSPQKGTYQYVLLPLKTAEETAAYSKNPDIKVLSNTDKLHVVKENKLGLCGMVFWEKGTFEDISASEPMLIMTKQSGNDLTLSIADASQLLVSGKVTVKGKYEVTEKDECTEVIYDGENTVITLNFKGSRGRAMEVKLR